MLDVPTGLGKTATMAVWLVARILGAPVPRRLVYIVDRRAVVDQATAVAEALREWVARDAAVREALELDDRALPVSSAIRNDLELLVVSLAAFGASACGSGDNGDVGVDAANGNGDNGNGDNGNNGNGDNGNGDNGNGDNGNGDAPDNPDLFPVEEDGDWGFIDADGEIQIALQYDEADHFSEGWARVLDGDSHLFIDEDGDVALDPDVAEAKSFSEGRALARDDAGGQWGYIDRSGDFAIDPAFDRAGPFSEGVAAVRPELTGGNTDDGWGYIDPDGEFELEPQFGGAQRFGDGLAPVRPDFGVDWGFIDADGNLEIGAQFYDAHWFEDGLAPVNVGDFSDREWEYIDTDGVTVLEPGGDFDWRDAQPFSEGMAPVQEEDEQSISGPWHYVDDDGNEQFGPYGFTEPFSRGLGRVSLRDSISSSRGAGDEAQYDLSGLDLGYIDESGDQVWPVEE